MAPSTFSNLNWTLETNPHNLKGKLLAAYRDKQEYLKYLDDLVYFLKSNSCKNIREKLNDASEIFHFHSTASEFEIAKALVQRGKSVDFLPQTYSGMASPPDLLVVDTDTESYIEVKRLIEDPTSVRLLEFLREFLRKHGYPYRIDVQLNEPMSIPAVGSHDRQQKEEVLTKALQEFESRFTSTEFVTFPARIQTNAGIFEIHQTESGRGYPGILWHRVIDVPEDTLVQKIRQDTLEKAEKREKWEGEHLAKLYIIALDFEQLFFDRECLETALIGNRVTYASQLPLPEFSETEEVKLAKERGWGDFMHDMCIVPRDRTYLDNSKKGIFFTEPVMKNVSGVIGRFQDTLCIVPNPFASNEINDSRLVSYV